MLYGHRILDAQAERQHVYGFLTNNQHTVLIRATRSTESPVGVVWGISGVLGFIDGMKSFFYLVRNDHDFFPPPTINGHILQINRQLRAGGTCRAFACIDGGGAEIVAKLYQDPVSAIKDHARLQRARAIVDRKVNQTLPTTLLPSPSALYGRWLRITPLGDRFTAKNAFGIWKNN
jgi:hypothetical protein